MIQQYLVCGPSRVGGHLITEIIKTSGIYAIHTHEGHIKGWDDTVTALILVDRRDIFSAIMSNCLFYYTKQWSEYNQTLVDPYQESEEQFKKLYYLHKNQIKKCDLSKPYKLIKQFYYEDFVNNYNYVYDELNITPLPGKKITTKPAPYNYRNIIINHEKLYELYTQLENI